MTNPQLIFGSVNSIGLDLSEGSRIRSHILMGWPFEQQEVYYDHFRIIHE